MKNGDFLYVVMLVYQRVDEQWWTHINNHEVTCWTFAIACSPCLFFMTTWLWPAGMVFWLRCVLCFAQVLHFSLFHPHSWVGLCLQVWHGRQHHPGCRGCPYFSRCLPWISGSNDFFHGSHGNSELNTWVVLVRSCIGLQELHHPSVRAFLRHFCVLPALRSATWLLRGRVWNSGSAGWITWFVNGFFWMSCAEPLPGFYFFWTDSWGQSTTTATAKNPKDDDNDADDNDKDEDHSDNNNNSSSSSSNNSDKNVSVRDNNRVAPIGSPNVQHGISGDGDESSRGSGSNLFLVPALCKKCSVLSLCETFFCHQTSLLIRHKYS